MIFVPEPMVTIFQKVFYYLERYEQVSDYGDYKGDNGKLLNPTVYDPRFWEEYLVNECHIEKMTIRQNAHFAACDIAKELDRWKTHLEQFPAVARRSSVCRHIDAFVHQALLHSTNENEAKEAVGLGIARMDTIKRRMPAKENSLCLAIAGDSRYLGNRKWRYKFESYLPKQVRFFYCYQHHDLLWPNDPSAQWVNNLSLKRKKNRYYYQGKLWMLKSNDNADGVIFVHNKESEILQVKHEHTLYCQGNLKDEDFVQKLQNFCQMLEQQK